MDQLLLSSQLIFQWLFYTLYLKTTTVKGQQRTACAAIQPPDTPNTNTWTFLKYISVGKPGH